MYVEGCSADVLKHVHTVHKSKKSSVTLGLGSILQLIDQGNRARAYIGIARRSPCLVIYHL